MNEKRPLGSEEFWDLKHKFWELGPMDLHIFLLPIFHVIIVEECV